MKTMQNLIVLEKDVFQQWQERLKYVMNMKTIWLKVFWIDKFQVNADSFFFISICPRKTWSCCINSSPSFVQID